MDSTQKISMRIKTSTLDKIKQSENYTTVSDFGNAALEHKLDNQQQSSKEFTNMVKKVEALNTKTTEQKVADIEIKLQIIYGELQRQNEILKLIHRRSTFAANFSLHALDELKKSTSFSDTEKQELSDITDNEIKQSGIQFLRK